MQEITTIIPCYNAEPYLGAAIESVLRQTRPVDEVIVVDDCSTDGSRDVAASYPVRLLSTKRNSGHATARNVAIQAARGSLIAWLDADDYWEAEHLEVVAGLLAADADATVAYSAVNMVGAREGVWYEGVEGLDSRAIFLKCVGSTIVPAMSAVTRRDALEAVGGFDESYRTAPDYPLWLSMSRRGRFVSTPRVTANYRWHNAQISANPAKQRESVQRARTELLCQLELEGNNPLWEDVIREIRVAHDRELSVAWGRHDRGLLLSVLEYSNTLPGEPTDRERMLRRRLALPGWPGGVWQAVSSLKKALGTRKG